MTRTADNSYTTITANTGCYLVPVGTEDVPEAYLMGKPVKVIFSNDGIIPAFKEHPLKTETK